MTLMTSIPWATPTFRGVVYPTLPLLGLSDAEKTLIVQLQRSARNCQGRLELAEAFYLGVQVVQNLRIAIPKELEYINPIVGWGAKAVDPYVERLHLDGFRVPGATDVDADLGAVLSANGFAAEQRLGFTDALSMGRSYWLVGSPEESGAEPVVTVESPLNTSVLWNLRGTAARAAMIEYWDEDRRRGSLIVPGKTVHLATDDQGNWVVDGRDEHGFDFVPIVRMANRPRTHDRDGRSEISDALRYYIANACRTLLGLEVSREIYSVPGVVLLGAAESDFQNSDGTAKSAWDTYITKVLALERDADGNLPQLQQKTPYDPSVFTKLLDWLASAAASEVASPPQDMGLYTQGNPATAEAVDASNARRDAHARNMQPQFGEPLKRVAQYAARFMNKGVLPDKYRTLDADWSPVSLPAPGIMSDAITKQVAAGVLPPTSDVTTKQLGYNAADRAQLEQDRKREQGQKSAQDIVAALTGNQATTTTPTPASGIPNGQ